MLFGDVLLFLSRVSVDHDQPPPPPPPPQQANTPKVRGQYISTLTQSTQQARVWQEHGLPRRNTYVATAALQAHGATLRLVPPQNNVPGVAPLQNSGTPHLHGFAAASHRGSNILPQHVHVHQVQAQYAPSGHCYDFVPPPPPPSFPPPGQSVQPTGRYHVFASC